MPIKRFYVPFKTSDGHAWPRPAAEMETEPYERAVKKALREFQRHFLQKRWIRTKLMMFYNRYDESDRVKTDGQFMYVLSSPDQTGWHGWDIFPWIGIPSALSSRPRID